MKCKIKMGDKVAPVEGSVKGDTGTCPECRTPGVLLSIVGGFIRAHVIADRETPENNPQPATLVVKPVKYGKGLREPVTDLTDTGARIGDPRTAEQRRVVEIDGATGTGTVKIPVKVPADGKGKRARTVMTDVPATEDNVRKALAHWKAKLPRTPEARAKQTPEAHAKQTDMIAGLFRRLEALRAGAAVLDAQASDVASVLRGPALVRGRDTAPRLRDPELSWDEPTDLRKNGQVRGSSTLDQPLGRERFDRKITDVPEPPKRRTASERRRYRRERQMTTRLARQSNKG